MSPSAPVTPLSDPRRPMPQRLGARRDVAEAAVLSLDAEVRRLSAQRLEWPLARATHQLRYWRFVHALCAMAETAAPRPGRAA